MRDPEYLPAGGGALDFGGEGHAVELDTFPHEYASDPESPHVAVTRKRMEDISPHSKHLAVADIPRGFPRDVWHPVRVDLREGVLSVSFGGEQVISDFHIPDFTPSVGYIGFTAATGGGYQRHLVRPIRFRFPPFEDAPDSPAGR